MLGGSTRAGRLRGLAPFLLASCGAHALLAFSALLPGPRERVEAREPVWLQSVSMPAPSPPPLAAAPEFAHTPEQAQKPRARSKPAASSTRPMARTTEQNGEGPHLTAADAESGGVAQGAGADGDATSAPGASSAAPTPRKELAPQLSLWLALEALQQLVIVRSPSALLAALPGYRDMLRGSDLLPFGNLQRLRVFMPGLSPERLVLAGVHRGGEPELMRAAQRVAASRERVPKWKGDASLRATSWVDGSGFDRGIAVHADAFLIGARTQLPRLLGEAQSSARVADLSSMRGDGLVLLALDAVERYVPALSACELRKLRLTVSRALQLQLTATYESAATAARAADCLASVPEAHGELSFVSALLTRARPHEQQSRLNTGVTREDVARLLDELCWSLRRVVHG